MTAGIYSADPKSTFGLCSCSVTSLSEEEWPRRSVLRGRSLREQVKMFRTRDFVKGRGLYTFSSHDPPFQSHSSSLPIWPSRSEPFVPGTALGAPCCYLSRSTRPGLCSGATLSSQQPCEAHTTGSLLHLKKGSEP